MKRRAEKGRKMGRGMPSAVVLSILIHAALFILAGTLVVFTVVKKGEKKFEPPRAVERPKVKLKKPKVRIRKISRPKPTTRIVSKISRASMPDIQLPEMSGIVGEGLEGGIGGFDMMPDLDEVSVFGAGQSIGNDFIGTFYDFKRDRDGRDIPMDPDMYRHALKEFVRSGWKTQKIARYYNSPKKLYATTFMVPPLLSSIAPAAFGENDTLGYAWMAHYKGKLVHQDGITFRFLGNGDDVLLVRVNGELVLNACWPGLCEEVIAPQWKSTSADNRKYRLGNYYSVVGDWITLEPGVPLDMEVMIGEVPGGGFAAMLVVQEKGVEYERNLQGSPILPIFKTTEPSLDLIEEIHGYLVEGEACVTNGPVFRDYNPQNKLATVDSKNVMSSDTVSVGGNVIDDEMRTWTGLAGRTFDAELVTIIGDKAVLKNVGGKMQKIPVVQLSEADQQFIELALPPKFNISFSKQSSLRPRGQSPFSSRPQPKIIDYVFSAKLTKTSVRPYNSELHVEFFAVGEEIDGDNYILFDRQKSRFVPSKENEYSHKFHGETVPLMDYDFMGQRRGEKYGGYLVVVTDSTGRIIDQGTSHKWLFKNLENLKQIPVGRHFDKTCTRVGPPRPKRSY